MYNITKNRNNSQCKVELKDIKKGQTRKWA